MHAQTQISNRGFSVEAVRRDFPVLGRSNGGKPLVYLDNAATTQKPNAVIDRVSCFYREENANIHRGLHFLSEGATRAYEDARAQVAGFINAAAPSEIVFTRNATEAINLVAASFVRKRIRPGQKLVLTVMEHHANVVPWQLLEKETGLQLHPVPLNDAGEVDLDAYAAALEGDVGFVALSHVSNTLGTINPTKEMIRMAKERGLPVLLDGAQAVPHFRVDVRDLDCDFYVFSGHKLFGPTGIGVLYGREELLKSMPPYQGGGDMIERVSFSGTTFAPPPARFEAGTPHIAGAIGLAAAIDYFESLDPDAVEKQEQALLARATEGLMGIEGLRILGTAQRKVAVASFLIEGAHPHDLATFLDKDGIAVRAGHHCTQPLMEFYGIQATIRASFAFYNTLAEVDHLVRCLHRIVGILR